MDMRRMTALLVGLGGALAVAACGGSSDGGGGITVINGNIAYFVVRGPNNQDTLSVLQNNTAQLTGKALDASLNELSLVGDTVWVSRDPSVASVDAHGLATAKAVGTVWIIGTFTPKSSQVGFSDSVQFNSVGPQ
jgi:hypothetical protein